MIETVRFEYAGFLYDIELDPEGRAVHAHPVAGQSLSAHMTHNITGAVNDYNESRGS